MSLSNYFWTKLYVCVNCKFSCNYKSSFLKVESEEEKACKGEGRGRRDAERGVGVGGGEVEEEEGGEGGEA